jgi:hypothetical protein
MNWNKNFKLGWDDFLKLVDTIEDSEELKNGLYFAWGFIDYTRKTDEIRRKAETTGQKGMG